MNIDSLPDHSRTEVSTSAANSVSQCLKRPGRPVLPTLPVDWTDQPNSKSSARLLNLSLLYPSGIAALKDLHPQEKLLPLLAWHHHVPRHSDCRVGRGQAFGDPAERLMRDDLPAIGAPMRKGPVFAVRRGNPGREVEAATAIGTGVTAGAVLLQDEGDAARRRILGLRPCGMVVALAWISVELTVGVAQHDADNGVLHGGRRVLSGLLLELAGKLVEISSVDCLLLGDQIF